MDTDVLNGRQLELVKEMVKSQVEPKLLALREQITAEIMSQQNISQQSTTIDSDSTVNDKLTWGAP